MIGLIQKTLLDLVNSMAGVDAVAEVKRRAGVPADKVYRIDEPYEDDEWERLLSSACEVLKVTQAQAEEAFADFFCRDALHRWPTWFKMATNSRQLLECHPFIHNSFASGVRHPALHKAIGDKFSLESRDAELVVHYNSPNRLCGLYMALARWIIAHYGDEATVEEICCVKKGDPECRIHVCWAQPAVL